MPICSCLISATWKGGGKGGRKLAKVNIFQKPNQLFHLWKELHVELADKKQRSPMKVLRNFVTELLIFNSNDVPEWVTPQRKSKY